MEHVLRQCLIALRIADQAGFGDEKRGTVYYTALLINVGCHTDAHEQARWFGDDIALKADKYRYDLHGLRGAAAAIRHVGAGHPLIHRFRIGLEFVVAGHRDLAHMISHHAQMASTFAEQLGLPQSVVDSVAASYEQWDGNGWPGQLAGNDIPIAARLAVIGEFAEVSHRVGGMSAATELVRRRSGTQFDPRAAEAFEQHAAEILEDLDSVETWTAVIDAEPALTVVLSDPDVDRALTTIADFVDLKSPFTLGHSRSVADLVSSAAEHLGQTNEEVRTL